MSIIAYSLLCPRPLPLLVSSPMLTLIADGPAPLGQLYLAHAQGVWDSACIGLVLCLVLATYYLPHSPSSAAPTIAWLLLLSAPKPPRESLLSGLALLHPVCVVWLYAIALFALFLASCAPRHLQKLHWRLLGQAIALALIALVLGAWGAQQELSGGGWGSGDPTELSLVAILGVALGARHGGGIGALSPLVGLSLLALTLCLRLGLFNSTHAALIPALWALIPALWALIPALWALRPAPWALRPGTLCSRLLCTWALVLAITAPLEGVWRLLHLTAPALLAFFEGGWLGVLALPLPLALSAVLSFARAGIGASAHVGLGVGLLASVFFGGQGQEHNPSGVCVPIGLALDGLCGSYLQGSCGFSPAQAGGCLLLAWPTPVGLDGPTEAGLGGYFLPTGLAARGLCSVSHGTLVLSNQPWPEELIGIPSPLSLGPVLKK